MNRIKEYFTQLYLGIKTSISGMILTIGYFFKKKVTLEYPEKKETLPLSYRGIHRYNQGKCIACEICKRGCPVSAISIEAEGKGKLANVKSFKIDYGKCLFCSMCEENCPGKAIYLSRDFNLSTINRRETVVDFANPDYIKKVDTATNMDNVTKKEE